MNPDSPKTPREELEARLTALLLGELSAADAASLRQTLAQDAELSRLHDRLKLAIELARETVAAPEEELLASADAPKLSSERREKLLQSFKVIRPKELARIRQRKTLWRESLAVAAMLVGLLVVAALVLGYDPTPKAKARAARLVLHSKRDFDGEQAEHFAMQTLGDVPAKRASGVVADNPPADSTLTVTGVRPKEAPASTANRSGDQGVVLAESLETLSRERAKLPAPAFAPPAPPVATAPFLAASVGKPQSGFGRDGRIALPEVLNETAAVGQNMETFGEAANQNVQSWHFNGSAPPNFGGQGGGGGAGGGSYGGGYIFGGNVTGGGGFGGRGSLGGGKTDGANFDVAKVTIEKPLDAADRLAADYKAEFIRDPDATTLATGTGLKQAYVELRAPSGLQKIEDGAPSPQRLAVDPATGLRLPNDEVALTKKPAVEPRPEVAVTAGAVVAQSQIAIPTAQTPPVMFEDQVKQNAVGKPVGAVIADASQPADVSLRFRTATNTVLAFGGQSTLGGIPGVGDIPAYGSQIGARFANVEMDKFGVITDRSPFALAPPSPAQQQLANGDAASRFYRTDVSGLAKADAKDSLAEGRKPAEVSDSKAGGVYSAEAVGYVNVDISKFKSQSTLGLEQLTEEKFKSALLPAAEPKLRANIELPQSRESEVAQEREVRVQTGPVVASEIQPQPIDAPVRALVRNLDESRKEVDEKGAKVPEAVGDLVNAGTLVQDGKLLFESGRLDDAEKKLKEAIKKDPNDQAAFYYSNLIREKRHSQDATTRDAWSRQMLLQTDQKWLESTKREAQPIDVPVRALARSLDESRKEIDDKEAKPVGGPVAQGAKPGSVEVVELGRQLESMRNVREKLEQHVSREETEARIPQSVVEIVDPAKAQSAKDKTVWERVRGTFGGDVERGARIAVQKNSTDVSSLGGPQFAAAYDPYWIQNEYEKIKSKTVLGKVVDKLNLNDTWAAKHGGGKNLNSEQSSQILKKMIDVRSDPNSKLIDIRVKSDNPDEAARIANTIAEVYREQNLEFRRELAAGGVRAFGAQLAELDKKITSAQQELDRRKQELNPERGDVNVPKPPTTAGIPQPEIFAAENPFSTFSLNVSDVSFKLAAASLEKGLLPELATVRSEEFINAFDYHDPEPAGSAPIAFAWERARYPFAHDRDLVRFSLKTAASGRQPGRPLNLVLLLDNSGSMERADRVRIREECLHVLAGQLQPADRVSVVAFARTARLWVDGLPGNQAGELAQRVGGLTPEGGTNLEEAMNLAYQTARRHFLANGVNRVVLLTDGAANLGDVQPDSLKKKVEAQRGQGIALDCFGIGWDGLNDELLEALSRNGDGRYGFVNTPEAATTEFASQLAGALKVAASDVKVQVEWNPQRVTAYRQIGYAKHQLTKEQFRDNTVDAAEIGAAEAGNALYVVQVNPAGEGPLGTVRVRFKIPGTSDYREHEWAVPYVGTPKLLEQSTPTLRLAASASAFSEWLVSSPYAAEVTPDKLLGYLNGVPEAYASDPRPQKLEWMIRQAKSVAGK